MAGTLKARTLGLRPSADVLARLDALAASVTASTGITQKRGGVAMDALLAGLEMLEAKQGRKRASK